MTMMELGERFEMARRVWQSFSKCASILHWQKWLVSGVAILLLGGCAFMEERVATFSSPLSKMRGPAFKGSDLMGASIPELKNMLGSASLERQEGLGGVHVYSFEKCSLLVFLYPDENGVASVSHMSASHRVESDETIGVDECLGLAPIRKKRDFST